MTRIVRIRLTLEVPDDVEIQVNRDDAPGEPGPELFQGYVELAPGLAALPVAIPAPIDPHEAWTPAQREPTLPGPAPLCPRHKKSREGKGGYFCPTVISPSGVEPKVWCDWRVKIG